MKTNVSPGLNRLKRLELKYKRLIERAYNLRQTDDSLSDFFYFEAEKLLVQLTALRKQIAA